MSFWRSTKQFQPPITEQFFARMLRPSLVLASTSVYRRQLLERLNISFETASPDIDETPHPGELPAATAERLAFEKASVVASRHPGTLVIGSDQVAYHDQERFDKPMTEERAIQQLRNMSGRSIVFHTAVCLYNGNTHKARTANVPTEARFRMLSEEEIVRYVQTEKPLDCAGSAKSEGLGISLLEYMRGDDPTALIGLPLIALCNLLRAEGIQIP